MYVGVIGTGEFSEKHYRIAYELGFLLGKSGHVIVCGGLYGVMEAVCKGCSDAGGVSIGLLPGLRREEANPYVKYAISTGLGEMRNALIIRASDVVVGIGGGFGTLSEIGFALKTGKKLILVDSWQCKNHDVELSAAAIYAENAQEAFEKIVKSDI